MHKCLLFCAISFLLGPIELFAEPSAVSPELTRQLVNIEGLISAEKYPQALDRLLILRNEIEQKNIKKILEFIPESISDYRGAELVDESALGLVSLYREYRSVGPAHSENPRGRIAFVLALTGGVAAGAGVLADLATVGRTASLLDTEGRTIQVSGRRALLDRRQSDDGGELSIFLNSGMVLKLSSEGGISHEKLKELATQIKIEALDQYLTGS